MLSLLDYIVAKRHRCLTSLSQNFIIEVAALSGADVSSIEPRLPEMSFFLKASPIQSSFSELSANDSSTSKVESWRQPEGGFLRLPSLFQVLGMSQVAAPDSAVTAESRTGSNRQRCFSRDFSREIHMRNYC